MSRALAVLLALGALGIYLDGPEPADLTPAELCDACEADPQSVPGACDDLCAEEATVDAVARVIVCSAP